MKDIRKGNSKATKQVLGNTVSHWFVRNGRVEQLEDMILTAMLKDGKIASFRYNELLSCNWKGKKLEKCLEIRGILESRYRGNSITLERAGYESETFKVSSGISRVTLIGKTIVVKMQYGDRWQSAGEETLYSMAKVANLPVLAFLCPVLKAFNREGVVVMETAQQVGNVGTFMQAAFYAGCHEQWVADAFKAVGYWQGSGPRDGHHMNTGLLNGKPVLVDYGL